MKNYLSKSNELFITTKGQITAFSDYNAKSYRFEATTEDFEDISGYVAKSLDPDLTVGRKATFTCKRDILNGTDESLTTKERTNFLWSIGYSRASDISDSMLDAINAL